MSNQEVAKDKLVGSFDVILLFSSILMDMAIDIVKRRLGRSDDWKKIHPVDQRPNNGLTLLTSTHVHQLFNI